MKNDTACINVINTFRTKRILVIGDLLLDVYLRGTSTRLCPEAPVPVVDIHEKTILPGGAANTVCNLRSLGASVDFCTAIGEDPEGDEAVATLKKMGVSDKSIVRDPSRKTVTKSRVVSGSQVITRIDEGSETAVTAETTSALLTHIEQAYEGCDGIIISDYNKGVITETLLERLMELQDRRPKFIAVDSKRLSFFSSMAPSLVKPNYAEAMAVLSLPTRVEKRIQHVTENAAALYERLKAPLIAVTVDSDGSVIIGRGATIAISSAPPVNAPQVAGAGDTYLSALVLSCLGDPNIQTDIAIATAAASIAVRKEGTSVCSQAELKSYFHIHTKYISDPGQLRDICDAYHHAGKRIVFTNGCFDILHSGHVTYLHRAKEMGDVLVVGLNTDESIKRIKGKSRPINSLADRLRVLAGLSSVDHIIAFGDKHDDTPAPVIRIVRPHIFAKGGDYSKDQLPEAQAVLACGGEIVFIDHVPDHSTTRIISKIQEVSHQAVASEIPS